MKSCDRLLALVHQILSSYGYFFIFFDISSSSKSLRNPGYARFRFFDLSKNILKYHYRHLRFDALACVLVSILMVNYPLYSGNYDVSEGVNNPHPFPIQWKAGAARIDITPTESMWLAGYGSRTSPSEGTLHSIWVKALALEDAQGNRSVLITSDLLGLPKTMSDNIRQKVESKYGLTKAQVILNSSHTHTGPVLGDALFDIYPVDAAGRKRIEEYTARLTQRIVDVIGEAIQKLEPAQLFSENGVARFQVNRRNNVEALQHRISDLNGPNDYAVPVIKVARPNGDLMAVVFGYACHPTVLSLDQWSGDYPGYAQIQLEKDHPGVQAMFFQGGGADQNPIPRRTIPLARQYGRTLAAAVDRVLEEEMKPLESVMKVAYKEVDLNLETPPTMEELTHFCEVASSYQKSWGERLLQEVKSGKKLLEKYPYPLQIWRLGDQSIFTLGGELLIGYTIRLKEMLCF